MISVANASEPVATPGFFTVVFSSIQLVISELTPKELTITSKGRGNTQEEAVQAALTDSVQRGIGILMITEQTVQNDKLIRNIAASYSSGVVNTYKVDTCEKDTFFTCTVTAKVSPWNLMRKLQGDSQTIQVRGNDLFMQHQTAKAVLIQREKMTRYYLNQIRESGLDVRIVEVKVLPNTSDMAKLSVTYEVKWNREFKEELIRFLKKLERDTQGPENEQVYIQWDSSSGRVWINTHNAQTRNMMRQYLYMPTFVKIKELDVCHNIREDDVFNIGWTKKVRNSITVDVPAQKLQNLQSLSASLGCAS
jgi:hypothetical protein